MRITFLLAITFLLYACNGNQTNDKEKPAKENIGVDSTKDTGGKIKDSSDFLEYWKDFRTAVLNSDTVKLASLTEFPVEGRGPLDSDPTIKYSKKKFNLLFNLFLSQLSGDGTSTTEFDIIKATEIPNEKVIKDQVRVSNMVFFKRRGGWNLNFLYLDYDTIDSLKHNNQGEEDKLDSCHLLLIKLLRTSSLDPDTKQFKFGIWVDRYSNGVAVLEITWKNEEKIEHPLGWIELDTKKKELRDITSDSIIKLKYDTVLFKKVVNSCGF